MSTMTGWLPPHIKPVHKGVYEIKYTAKGSQESGMYATWNGEKWSIGAYDLHTHDHKCFDAIQEKYWRGFTGEQT